MEKLEVKKYNKILVKDYYKQIFIGKNLKERFKRFSFLDHQGKNEKYTFFKSQNLKNSFVNKKQCYKVEILDLIENYNSFFLKPSNCTVNKKNHFFKIKNFLLRDYLFGYILKNVKGGFLVDFNGFIGFMPYSFGEISKVINTRKKLELQAIQVFQRYKTGLNSNSSKEIFFNAITSRKLSFYFLKKILKGYNFTIINNGLFNYRKENKIKIKHKRLRIFVMLSKEKNGSFLKFMKEVLISFNRIS